MTNKMRLPEHPELEPPLPELPRLRELLRLETPNKAVRRAVYTRVQHTLNVGAPSTRSKPRARAWALSLAVVVVVPSALAATPAGALVVQHTVAWATQVWAVLDSAIAVKDTHQAHPVHQAHPANQAPSAKDLSEASPPAAATVATQSVQSTVTAPSTPTSKAIERARTPGGLAPPNPAVTPSVRATSGVHVDRRAPEQPPTLTAERQLLEAARMRLRAGDTSGALKLATRHAHRFPKGILTAERQAIINQVHQLQSQKNQ